jgi:hypothetical protein
MLEPENSLSITHIKKIIKNSWKTPAREISSKEALVINKKITKLLDIFNLHNDVAKDTLLSLSDFLVKTVDLTDGGVKDFSKVYHKLLKFYSKEITSEDILTEISYNPFIKHTFDQRRIIDSLGDATNEILNLKWGFEVDSYGLRIIINSYLVDSLEENKYS